jgi:hypothetical protein
MTAMKRLLLVLVIGLGGLNVKAQQDTLGMGANGIIYNLPSSLNFWDSMNFFVYFKNISVSSPFSDTLYGVYGVDSTAGITRIDSVMLGSVSLNPGDSIFCGFNEIVYPWQYRAGGNIVVIWPSANSIIKYYGTNTEIQVSGNLGTGELSADKGILVYPNPASTEINFTWMPGTAPIKRVRLRDISGKLLLDTEQTHRIALTSFESGIYFAEILLKSGEYVTRKIVVSQ